MANMIDFNIIRLNLMIERETILFRLHFISRLCVLANDSGGINKFSILVIFQTLGRHGAGTMSELRLFQTERVAGKKE